MSCVICIGRWVLYYWCHLGSPKYVCVCVCVCVYFWNFCTFLGLPCSSNSKESGWNAGDPGSNPGMGKSSREGNGNPRQYSCLENPMDGGAWQATVHWVAKSWTWLSNQLLPLLCTGFYQASPFCIPTNNTQVFQLLLSLVSTNLWFFFDTSHHDWCEMLTPLWFWFAFLWW